MQDKEREPDLMGADDDALEKKVHEMMDTSAKAKKLEAKKVEIKNDDTPEVIDLPKAKEPLKIKILKEEPEEETESAPKTSKLAKKQIDVKHEEGAPPIPDSIAAEALPEESISEEVDSETTDEEKPISESEPEAETEVTPEAETEEAETSDSSETKTEEQPDDETTAESTQTPEEPAGEEVIAQPYEDDKTSEAVDDIVVSEGDEILASEDEKIAAAFKTPEKPSFSQKLRGFLSAWWHNPTARWLTFIFVFLALVTASLVPTSRYFILNTAGARSGLSLQVLDQSTQQPLRNVNVSVGGSSGTTGADGRVKLVKVKLGPSSLIVEKRAFSAIHQSITVGWGSNPLGSFQLTPTGTQYSFVVTDYLSGKGVEGVEADSGDANALSDQDGKIKLTIDQPEDKFEVTFNKDGLRQEKLQINADNKSELAVKTVPARKEVFISKRSGKFDVYKIDIDGKNEEKVLAGTGSERDDITLASHPSDEVAALVSTRDNKRNQDGFLLSTLTLIDLSDNSTTSVVQSEQVQILDWIGNRLIYVQIAQGASAANPKRHRLMSYDYKTHDSKELASSNYFNDVIAIGTKVYYAPSSAYQNSGEIGLFKIDADGNNKQTILSQEVWNFFRTSYENLTLSADKNWFNFRLGDKTPTKLDGQPANLTSRIYVSGPDGKKSLWVDNRDGKGVLLAYDSGSQNEQILRTQSGLKNPVRWLSDNIVIYRINTEQETADYALSLNGGEPKKIRDVTNTSGVDNWYYY